YYAMWARNKYKITLAKNENYNPSVQDPYLETNNANKEVEVLYDQKLSDISWFADKTRSGYTYTGKFTMKKIPEPMDRKYYYGTDYYTKDTVYRETKDMTLYPLWKNSEQTVTLNIHPENGNRMPDGYINMTFIAFYDAPYNTKGTVSEPKYANGTIVSPIATPHETTMFNYWSTTDGDTTGANKIDPNSLYTDTSVRNLYAYYKTRGKFTIIFNAGEGGGSMANQEIIEGMPTALRENAFKKSRYYFAGWKINNTDSYYSDGQVITLIDNDNIASNNTIYLTAQWIKEAPSYRGGGGGSGGGGGGGGGGTLPRAGGLPGAIDSILNSIIISNVGAWVYYPEENAWGYKIPVDDTIAQAIIKDKDLNTKYALVDDGSSIQLKNGVYRISDMLTDYYYAFNDKARMATGFMVTTEDTKMYALNQETNKIELVGYAEPGKYYFMESGPYMGAMCTRPITINNITYIFDGSGRIIMEIKNIVDNDGAWYYIPEVNKWVYIRTFPDGTHEGLKDGVYAIPALDGIYYYIFDEEGYMKTGMTEYNGRTYYLQEIGLLQGTVYTGDLVRDGKVYSFSPTTGELINIVDAAAQTIPVIHQ
ncbi:MAG: hypothetical protein IKI71_04365, partial [Lachnospiraceae bacterium]|nr:hypothetical protein [Lachnospiraceae bacterium]